MIGGATTSKLHTALKIAPAYEGTVVWMKDASQNALVASKLLNPDLKEDFIRTLHEEQASLRLANEERQVKLVSFEEASSKGLKLFD